MDDDDLRRGRPTPRPAREDVAILAGDALYAEAFRRLLTAQEGPPDRILGAARELAAATGADGMVGGFQFPDIADTATTPDALRTVHALKTGRLIGASVGCVLLLHGVVGASEEAYRRYAAEPGVLFQIVDDILDVRDRHRRSAGQAAGQRRAPWQAHVRLALRP